MKNIILGLCSILAVMACEKKDPFTDRVVAPVLVQVSGDDMSFSSGMTAEPTVNSAFDGMAKLNIRLLELDKTNILDYTKGIDSIPAASVSLSIKLRSGEILEEVSTNAEGVASLEMDWSELSVSGAGESVALMASGSYKDVEFTKLFKIAAK
ncbi:hypothetical protein LAG90_14710 [Marinilongibacter aquaticus]|uniref:hypothetical protein n=1 Tax=Marinilongibacter aquaticus TaxID=2975157 RepID=UPI0021BD2A6C|nr:hypothetical protein [Marinilongibacter aquaticus]UBM58056.1 hypothetical protein LAG90_14710 [Marinilongibacter aquaticus]